MFPPLALLFFLPFPILLALLVLTFLFPDERENSK